MASDFVMKAILNIGLAAMALVLGGLGQTGHAQDKREIAVVRIPEGHFIAGSDAHEREYGYTLDETAYGHSVTRKNGWYDRERKRSRVWLRSYSVMQNPVTNKQYWNFTTSTGYSVPHISSFLWKKQGLIHPYSRVERHLWKNGKYPKGRKHHPVVLVTWEDANAFAKWLSESTGRLWRLPSELEWEKAARGTKGYLFPWGNDWRPELLNSHDLGPFDTVPVGIFPAGASPFGVNDMAGQVFEWTSTSSKNNKVLVKGGSWDDRGCGVCRAAARHSRPKALRHILIGFRLVTTD